MKKITFFIGSMNRGGAERVISILSRSYAERGYETDIIMLLSDEVGYSLHPNTRILNFSGSTSSRIKRLPYWVKKIRNYVKEVKPDVIVSFVARINVIVYLATLGMKKRLIVSERNDPRYDGRSFITDIATKAIYPKVNSVVFQTKRAKEYFKNLKNGVIIPNPINVECSAINETGGKIVTVGRLAPQKNQKMLIEAFSKVTEKYPDAFLEIYGEGDLRDELALYISNLGLADRIKLMGNVTDIHSKISDASIFCLPSDYEGLSNALLEAMMVGLPCITTDCAGADEYIEDGVNGFIVEVGDSDSFADRLDTMLSNEELRKSFAKKAKETSEKFATENVMLGWDNVIYGENND